MTETKNGDIELVGHKIKPKSKSRVPIGQEIVLQLPNKDLGLGKLVIFKTKSSGNIYWFKIWVRSMHISIRRTTGKDNVVDATSVALKQYGNLAKTISSGGKYMQRHTLRVAIQEYLKERFTTEVQTTPPLISRGRWDNINCILNTHLCNFIGFDENNRDYPLHRIDRNIFKEYFGFRLKEKPNLQLSTLRNEKSIINHFFKWCIRDREYMEQNQTPIFQENIFRNYKPTKRDAFTLEDWRMIYHYLQEINFDKSSTDRDAKLYNLMMFKWYVMILGNCSLRPAELRKISWFDLTILKGKKTPYATISLDADKSKVKRPRIAYANEGDYFRNVKRFSKYTKPNDFIFTNNVGNQMDKTTLSKNWRDLLYKTGLIEKKDHDLYCLRHMYITFRLQSKVNIYDLATICGTSVSHIQNNYMQGLLDADKLTTKDEKIDARIIDARIIDVEDELIIN